MLRDQPFMRDDTFLGVCQSLGEDFRIPSNLLRVAMAPLLIWFPVATLTVYVALGVIIAISRWIFPNPSKAAPAALAPAAPAVEADEPMILAKAA